MRLSLKKNEIYYYYIRFAVYEMEFEFEGGDLTVDSEGILVREAILIINAFIL